MGQRVSYDFPASKLSEDPPRRKPCPGVEKYISDQINIDAKRRESSEQLQILGEPSHGQNPRVWSGDDLWRGFYRIDPDLKRSDRAQKEPPESSHP
jgi:hypothetical protein